MSQYLPEIFEGLAEDVAGGFEDAGGAGASFFRDTAGKADDAVGLLTDADQQVGRNSGAISSPDDLPGTGTGPAGGVDPAVRAPLPGMVSLARAHLVTALHRDRLQIIPRRPPGIMTAFPAKATPWTWPPATWSCPRPTCGCPEHYRWYWNGRTGRVTGPGVGLAGRGLRPWISGWR